MCLKIKRSLEKAKERKTMKYQETREKVLEVAVKCLNKGLIHGTAGNVSMRVPGEDVVIITPSGIPYDQLTPEQLPAVSLHAELLDGEFKPSTETPMHTAVGLIAGVLYSAINLLLADRNQEIICEVCGEQFRGLSFCTMAFPVLVPIGRGIDWVIDHIPGVRKINFNLKSIPSKVSFLAEPIMIGFLIGGGLALLARYDWDQCLNVGMTMAAAMFLLPRMISILMEGLSPIATATREFMAAKFPNREFRIGIDFALLVGDPDMITLGLLFVPISLIMAVLLPGNRVLPLIGLTNLSYMMMAPVITSKRNMFRALIIGLIMVALVFFMATSLTPLITPAVIDAGLAEAGGNYSLFNTGEHVGFLILQVLKAIF